MNKNIFVETLYKYTCVYYNIKTIVLFICIDTFHYKKCIKKKYNTIFFFIPSNRKILISNLKNKYIIYITLHHDLKKLKIKHKNKSKLKTITYHFKEAEYYREIFYIKNFY